MISVFTQSLQQSFRNRQVHFPPKFRTVMVPSEVNMFLYPQCVSFLSLDPNSCKDPYANEEGPPFGPANIIAAIMARLPGLHLLPS